MSSVHVVAAAQKIDAPAVAGSATGYRIAGTVVSKSDGRPLARTRITVRDTKDSKKFQSMVTAEDGRYEFSELPAGKYSLMGAKRGFISASYDQHDQYSTAIVTGAGIDTESLVLRLAPDAVIAGKVLDESNEPVRNAQVTVYYDDHSSGVDQIRQFRSAQANDLGEYEITPLQPGIYFLSANGKPWYAIHPRSERNHSEPDNGDSNQPAATPPTVDRSFDVAYPVTYYPDVTESDDAMPIPIRGGERVEADIHLTPVPSLRLLFHVPDIGNRGFLIPQLQEPAFDGYTSVQAAVTHVVSPGLVEVTGIPAGHYNVRLLGQGQSLQMNGVDLAKDGEEIDTTRADAVSKVKFLVQVPGERTLPTTLSVGLRAGSRTATHAQAIDTKGEAELDQVAAGKYEVVLFGGGKPYSIAHISAEGAEVSGHAINVAAGSSPTVSLALVGGSVEVQGRVTKAGKGMAGAMVVLVPKNVELDHDLFRRDQSDLDGTFLLRNVVPGSYTLLAIENGWDLDWSKPGVIGVYLKGGRKIEVKDQGGAPMNVAEAIEVQSK
ncbi:MAG: carboxypeptidase-like regulatory domain-containing protein [Candidatus Sulfotelmatobacter sp.]